MLGGEVERAPAPMRPAEESGCTDSRSLGCWVAVTVLIGSLPPVRLKAAVSTAMTWFHHRRLVLRAWLVRQTRIFSLVRIIIIMTAFLAKSLPKETDPCFEMSGRQSDHLAVVPLRRGKNDVSCYSCDRLSMQKRLCSWQKITPPPPQHQHHLPSPPPPPPIFFI